MTARDCSIFSSSKMKIDEGLGNFRFLHIPQFLPVSGTRTELRLSSSPFRPKKSRTDIFAIFLLWGHDHCSRPTLRLKSLVAI